MSINQNPVFRAYEKEDMRARQYDAYANAKYEILLSWLDSFARSGLSILNVGCGSGELCVLLARRGHTVLGIDPAPEYISAADALCRSANLPNCTFAVSDLAGVSAHPGHAQYDVVFSTDVVEHIADDVQAMQQLAALVKPDGELFIAVPGGQYLFGFHDEQLGHYRRYSLRQLAGILPSSLTLVRQRYFGLSLIPVAWLYSQVFRRYYPVAETGNWRANPVRTRVLQFVLALEKSIDPPLGTSCLLWAKKNASVLDR